MRGEFGIGAGRAVRLGTWLLLLLGCTLGSGCALAPETVAPVEARPLRVATFNVRYANPGDGLHHWSFRRPRVAQLMGFHELDVIGLQEALAPQLTDLDADWPQFTRVGVGRDDGDVAGEFSPIYVRMARLEVVDSGTFWLSETPDRPSAHWAQLHRICTWARLRERESAREVLVMNTHWDHQSAEARLRSAELMKERAKGLGEGVPVILMGDLNCQDNDPPCDVLGSGPDPFFDARAVSLASPYGPRGTFTGFQMPPETEAPAPRIDFVWVRGDLQVLSYGVLPHYWDGRLASDHRPVMATLVLGAPPGDERAE